jgi:serine/threonine protein kinase
MSENATEDNREQIRAIFFEAYRKQSLQERSRYLDEVCGSDAGLRTELESLLAAHEGSNGFLEESPMADGITLDESPLSEGPGTIIGRYKLLERIGEGGMAVVYMAEQAEPIRRKVALKIIKLGMDTRQVIARFEAERQALAMMDHANIAKVLDAGATETGRPYFVMELVKGVSITEYCDSNELSTRARLDLFLQVCNAVQHAHQKGIIHRDLKPSNVMVTQRDGMPVPKVIDFGIAKATNQRLTEKTLFTRYAHIIGTPAYMSPEQAELSDLDVDTRTDIYSLGVLLYELLTGTTPFSEEELRKAGYIEMQRVIREEEPAKPSTKLSTLGETSTDVAKRRGSTPDLLRKAIRGDLDWIVMKALEKARDRRYDTVSALAMDVQRHLSFEPVLARAPSTVYHVRKFLRRHRSWAAVSLVVILLISALLVTLSMWNRKRLQFAKAESIEHRRMLFRAQDAHFSGQHGAALEQVRLILDSKHVGPEARLLYDRILATAQEKVGYFTDKIEANPEDANNYCVRAQCYDYLGDRASANADMRRWSAVAGGGQPSDLLFGPRPDFTRVLSLPFDYELVFSAERPVNTISVVSVALEQKGRCKMRFLKIPIFFTSLLGPYFLSGLDAPLAYADFTFGEPVNLKSVIPAIDPAHESIGCFSYDGLEMYFYSDRPGGQGGWDLWVLKRASISSDWATTENLGPAVNTSSTDSDPTISADGLTLYFSSKRPGGYGETDIYLSTRTAKDAPWSPPVNLPQTVNGSAREGAPWISPDGLELYFRSIRSGGYGGFDIYVAKRATTNDTWGEAENLGPVVNSPYAENYFSLSPDGLLLLFSDQPTGAVPRPGGYGRSDMWMTRRATISSAWQAPTNLTSCVNSSMHEILPRLSRDGSMLYFATVSSGGTYENWQAPVIPVVDFNSDGKVDRMDVGLLMVNWGTDNSLYDIGSTPLGDGIVDSKDLMVLAEHGAFLAGDANFDGVVNFLDLVELSKNWLQDNDS